MLSIGLPILQLRTESRESRMRSMMACFAVWLELAVTVATQLKEEDAPEDEGLLKTSLRQCVVDNIVYTINYIKVNRL